MPSGFSGLNDSSTIVQKLWNYCNVLRDDGVSYGDYVEQLTYLLFLKMADEQTKPPYSRASIIPPDENGNALGWIGGKRNSCVSIPSKARTSLTASSGYAQ